MAEVGAPEGLCDLLQDGIQQYDELIVSLGRRIAALDALLEQLKGKPDPDPEKIDSIRRQLADLQRQVTEAEEAKLALQDEFSFLGCGSHG